MNQFSYSFSVLFSNIGRFLPFMIGLYLLGLCIALTTYFGVNINHPGFWLVMVLASLLSMWIRASLVVNVNDMKRSRERGLWETFWEGACATPWFLIYLTVQFVLTLTGLVLFLIPGLYVMTALYFAPFLAIIEPSTSESYLRLSWDTCRKGFWKVFALSLIFIFSDVFHFPTNYIQDPNVKLAVEVVAMIPGTLLAAYADILAVNLYYSLRSDSYYGKDSEEGWEGR